MTLRTGALHRPYFVWCMNPIILVRIEELYVHKEAVVCLTRNVAESVLLGTRPRNAILNPADASTTDDLVKVYDDGKQRTCVHPGDKSDYPPKSSLKEPAAPRDVRTGRCIDDIH